MVDGEKYWFEDDGTGKADGGDENASEERENELSVADRDSFFGDGTPGNRSSASDASAKPSDGGADPHARHYQSDFAARTSSSRTDGGAVGGTVGGEKRKAVRGKMLKKLLKYDYRALFRFLLPCYIVLFALAALSAICLPVSERIVQSNNESATNAFIRIVSMVAGFYAICVFGCSIFCAGNIVTRFYKNFFTAEGYLTLSIPATPEEHIFSKLISGVVTLVLTFLVAIASLSIVALPYGSSVFPAVGEFLGKIGRIYASNPVDSALYTVEIALSLICGLVFGLVLIYSCVCAGQMFVNKNRALTALVAFVIWVAVSQVISVFTGASGVTVGIGNFSLHLLLWLGILIDCGLSVAGFFWIRYVFRNKVNLG